MTKIGNFLSYFIFLFSLSTQAAVTAQSTVDRNEMGMGDTLTLTISLSSSESLEVQEPRLQSLDGFELVNAWNSSSTASKLVQGNGGFQFETIRRQDFNYMITPTRTGAITIPSVEVVAGGKQYFTKPITVQVSAEGSGAATPPANLPQMPDEDESEDVFNQLLQNRNRLNNPAHRTMPKNQNEAFFVQIELDKTDVYEGEQIVANWYIYTRGNILSLDRLKFPDLKGFWKEIIEEVPALNFTQEVINGIPYRKALLASHALFPIKPGTAIVDEYRIKATVQVPTNPFSAFGFGRPYSFTKVSERVKINVKPLPVDGKPNDFSGAVGQFDVRASIEGERFPVNQPFSLKVRFEGSGNAKLIEIPSLNLPKNMEVYDTKSESKFFKNGRSYKQFDVLLIPREEGKVTIPEMTFSLFDPQQKKYIQRKTEAIEINVTANPNAPKLADGDSGALTEEAKAPEKKNVLPGVLLTWNTKAQTMGTRWAVWGLLYFLIAAVLGWKAYRDLGQGEKKRNLNSELQKRLKRVHPFVKAGDYKKVGTEMTNLIYSLLGALTGEKGASVEMAQLLDQLPPSLRRELGEDIRKVIDVFQVMSFAPETVVGSLKETSEMAKQVEQAEKVLKRALKLSEDKASEDQRI